MRIKYLILPLLFCFLACNPNKEERSNSTDPDETETQIAFDKIKWSNKEGSNYPYRDQMLNDVLYSDSVRALAEDDLLELLGEPDRTNEGHLYYTVSQRRIGSWPLHTKTLVIKIAEDSTVEWIKVHE